MNPQKNIEKTGKVSDEKLKKQFGNKTPFVVPDGYFDTLPENLMEATKKAEDSGRYFSIKHQSIYGIAAAAAILIFCTIFFSLYFNSVEEENSITNFDVEEIYLYNINQLSDLDETYLLSIIEDLDASLYSNEVAGDSISNEVIIEYLLAENHIEYLTLTDY
jgi:high-affinity nickel permease